MVEKIQDQDEAAKEPEAKAPETGEEAVAAPPVTAESATEGSEHDQLRSDLVTALKTVFDPEIPVDIYELGLI